MDKVRALWGTRVRKRKVDGSVCGMVALKSKQVREEKEEKGADRPGRWA